MCFGGLHKALIFSLPVALLPPEPRLALRFHQRTLCQQLLVVPCLLELRRRFCCFISLINSMCKAWDGGWAPVVLGSVLEGGLCWEQLGLGLLAGAGRRMGR